jgi:hypothetical protein
MLSLRQLVSQQGRMYVASLTPADKETVGMKRSRNAGLNRQGSKTCSSCDDICFYNCYEQANTVINIHCYYLCVATL